MEVRVRYRAETLTVVASSVAELRLKVASATGAAHVKLIAHGRMVEDGEALPAMVLALGTSSTEAEQAMHGVEAAARERLRKRERDVVDDLEAVDINDDVEEGTVLGDSLSDSNPRTGFGAVEVLPLGERDEAERILRRLARDWGVRRVMRMRGWFVPVLGEMYPDGKVGEDPVCVLGLNENKGQRILLRLRTDDLKGFRKFLSVKKVLFHELAHNERSEHDAIFYGLVSDIERQVNAHAADGHRLGGGYAPRRKAPTAARLGGTATLDEARANLVGGFALCECCGQPNHDDGVPETKHGETEPIFSQDDDVDMDDVAAPLDEELPPGVAPGSREATILEASRELGKVDVTREAATTLQIILNNAERSDDDKFRRIRVANKRFLRTAGKFAAALRLLEAVGFERETQDNEDVLVFKRLDPGLLWLGRSALTDLVAAAA